MNPPANSRYCNNEVFMPVPMPTLVKPPASASTASQVTDAELARYAELIYQRTGIRVSARKKTLLSNRLRRRLRETGIKDFAAYLQHLKKIRPADPEWDAFFEEITTHETYLYRDESQWEWFCSYLKQRSADSQRNQPPRRLRIWSAACSTGDEACTAACCILSTLSNTAMWNIHILGTDIGTGTLDRATAFTYGRRAMQRVPRECLKYFHEEKAEGVWKARPAIASMIKFRQHNLMDRLVEPPFDLVFLKNVLIYFDSVSKKKVLENVRASIAPGGLLVSGAAEGISDMMGDFNRLKPWLFEKPKN